MKDKQDLMLLAIVGMPGSGKSELLKTLVDEYNFTHLYYGDITFDEVKRLGLEINETNERIAREGLRKSGDLGIYSKLMVPKIEDAVKEGSKRIILESMYNVQEYEVIRDRFGASFKVLAIHSDKDVRQKRLSQRKIRGLTEEELTGREISEAKNLWKGTLIAMADYHYINNGNDMASFCNDLKSILKNKLGLESSKNFKEFNVWNEKKKNTENKEHLSVNVGEVFWCRMGVNVGFEEDGKSGNFLRPVIVLHKFSKEIFFGVPVTSKLKSGSWYCEFGLNGKLQNAILSQSRTFDTKRLENKIGQINKETLLKIKSNFLNLLN